jgi:hypothetical protein
MAAGAAGIISPVFENHVSRFCWVAIAALFLLSVVGCGGGGDEAAPAGASIQVDSTADTSARDGVITLREALLLATGGLPSSGLDVGEADNVMGEPGAVSGDVITFDQAIFPPSHPATIALASPLPVLSGGGDTISATGAGVVVDGGSGAFDCVVITSARNTASGLEVRGCKIGLLLEAGAAENAIGGALEGQGNIIAANQTGLRIEAGADRNVVEGNRIGTDRYGGTADANELGIFVGGDENVISGHNIISGNERVGVTVAGGGNVVSGNHIGTDPSGSVAIPNGVEGIWVAGQRNTIGGSTAAERNVISGNGLFGINVSGSGATDNVVKGNYIGVDATGQNPLANRNGVGVSFGAQNNVIGGDGPDEGNVISGDSVGVLVRDTGTVGNVFHGNRIGLGAVGREPVPNGVGISVLDGAQDSSIGGTAEGEGNVVSANGVGVLVEGDSTAGHTIRGNSVFSNVGAGIEIRDGGNGGLEPPVITDLGPVRGSACAGCTVDIYSDDADEGQIYEGSTVAGPDGTFEVDVEPDGPNVTATATDANGNTSVFSRPLAVPP